MATICVYKWMYLYLSSTMISNRPQQKRACGCVCNLESISFCKTDLLISSSLYNNLQNCLWLEIQQSAAKNNLC